MADRPDKPLVMLTAAELEERIEARVRAAVKDEVEKLCEPRFLTLTEVAEMLAVSTKYVGQLVAEQGLPVARKLGRELRFERDAVVGWMRGVGQPAQGEPPRLRRGHLERVK